MFIALINGTKLREDLFLPLYGGRDMQDVIT